MKKLTTLLFAFLFMAGTWSMAKENVNSKASNSPALSVLATGCQPTTAKIDLDLNNVRTKLLAGGDMWWDLSNAKYEVPKGSGLNSLFAGALWIGGIDPGGQLKVAAHTYRQNSGYDFWAGPINQATGDVTSATCLKYDRHWKVTREQVEEFIDKKGTPGYSVPEAIRTWPGNGDASNNEEQFLAPFFDANNDGFYDYNAGDYPFYDLSGSLSCKACGDPNFKDILFGDQTIWWVFNDVGNIHTETDAPAIGLEVQAQAFAFRSGDEINNMTFYKYKVINRGTITLNNTYFGQWVDPDLGNYADDYVGCDVARGLGYCYNGDADDEGPGGYGLNPPAIGVDFFQGPVADPGDGIDNNNNGVIDENCEEIIMSRFVYYNNDFSNNGNPEIGQHFYDYLRGIWKDGTPFTYGGSGYNPAGGLQCSFIFPGDSDPTGIGTGGTPQAPWFDQPPPADRRFLQSAGTFTLQPGAVNYITTGVVWARTTSGGPLGSVQLIRAASDKAQGLFDNCFKLPSGPKTPDVAIRELDKKLILSLQNTKETEAYDEIDPSISTIYPDRKYKFQGYLIFQLADGTVSLDEVSNRNTDKVRLVAQVDVIDNVTQIVNYTFDQNLGAYVPMEMVKGENKGIKHTYVIDKDLFALGNNALVNYKTYHFTVVAYAYNNYKTYNPIDPAALDGQTMAYRAGVRNVKVYSAIPHKVYGVDTGAGYGDGPAITRIEGQGNGGGVLDFADGVEAELFANTNYVIANPVYKGNSSAKVNSQGPINVSIFDPVKVKAGTYEVKLLSLTDTSRWVIRNLAGGAVDTADFGLSTPYEQLFPKLGMSVKLSKVLEPGEPLAVNNGFLEGSIGFSDIAKSWLSGVADQDGNVPQNWIRSGTESSVPTDYVGLDDIQAYEKVVGGTWAPYRLTSKDNDGIGPKWPQSADALSPLNRIPSVDVVFTSDKSKWTRSCVVEMANGGLGIGGANRFDPRKSPSVDKDGNADGTGDGMGWFPGYAVNMETGERLNIIFGENSFFQGDKGADMKWNPTSNRVVGGTAIFGGQHYIYVMATKYDECATFATQLNLVSTTGKRNTYKDAMWVSIPILRSGSTLLSSTARVRLRVAKSYATFQTATTPINNNFPMYRFSTGGLNSAPSSTETLTNILDRVKVVPNPYYAFSDYEVNQLDNRVKIINLPPNCSVSIYSINGTLIKQFGRAVPGVSELLTDGPGGIANMNNFLDWDLKNTVGVPVASGIYLVHVKVDGVGEKVIKWFGTMRPIDVDSF